MSEVVSEEVRQGGAGAFAAIRSVIAEESEFPATRDAGTVGSSGESAIGTRPHAIAREGVCELIRVRWTWPDAHLRMPVSKLMQRGIAVFHTLLEVSVCPQIEGTLLHTGLSGIVRIVLHSSAVVRVAVHYAACTGTHAHPSDEVSILVLGGRAHNDAFVGEIGAEVAEGTLPHAEVGDVIGPADHSDQGSSVVGPAVRDARLSSIFSPPSSGADAHTTVSSGVSEGSL